MSDDNLMKLVIKEPIEIEAESFDALVDFLMTRESDIAQDIENFGSLKGVFRDIFQQEAGD